MNVPPITEIGTNIRIIIDIKIKRKIENPPEDFNINLYNNRKVSVLKDAAVPDLLVEFRKNRQHTAGVIHSLTIQDLERTGRHPYLGIAPLAEIIKIIYRHNQIHIREIRKVLSKAE